jgi:5,10-methylene-tetrahydrofolate dehydrogenase/methenyl tetrahydrofolate cyclohydrolase
VGHPTAELLKHKGATVFVCHSQTPNPQEISRKADIVIVAIGKPEFIDASYIHSGAIVIDVGINSISGKKLEEELPKRRLVGDVQFASVSPLVSAISPVPGGVGPVTVAMLLRNVRKAYISNYGH